MTKEELKQVRHIDSEIRMWKKELERLRCKSIISGSELDGQPKSAGIGDNTGNLATEMADIEIIITGRLAELQRARKRATEYIMSIDDSLKRQIVYYRVCSLMSWQEIATNIGAGYTANSIRVIYHRWVSKL